MSKTFVLDTNVLLFDPNSIFKFSDNDVHIPLIVVEELDRFKKDQSENGRNARLFSRIVDKLREKGSLGNGVPLESGGKLFISVTQDLEIKNSFGIDLSINDNVILKDALSLKNEGKDVTLISKDINLRLKSDALGVSSEDYESTNVTFDELYKGQRVINVSSKELDSFSENRFFPIQEIEGEGALYPNEYIYLTDEHNEHQRKLGRFCKKKGGIVPLVNKRDGVWGIFPKNQEQQFALDALLNNEINLVSLVGKAGTGKTLLAIAAGLEATINQQTYTRVLVSRPIIPMGRDLGFLPGDINEKLGPWMQPIFDNIDFLFGNKKGERDSVSWEELINQGLLHVEPLTYIRGRSLPGQYMIVDEAQNLSPHEIKTIITRAGEGTKIVLTGDCEQIDSPYLDSINNGLSHCIERLKDEEIVSHAYMKSGERSLLSEIASLKL